MSCGTPLMASNLSSLSEIMGQAAVLVEPKEEEEDIAEAMWRIFNNKALR